MAAVSQWSSRGHSFSLAEEISGGRKGEAFRKLNYALHGIEVLTYDDLISRGEHLVTMYSNGHSVADRGPGEDEG